MPSHSYDAIDKEMKKIAKNQGITPKELHDNFKSAHNGQIPDEWVKDQTSNNNSEMDQQARPQSLSSEAKAQKINEDRGIYGSFAEIGAGQETAAHFFNSTKIFLYIMSLFLLLRICTFFFTPWFV